MHIHRTLPILLAGLLQLMPMLRAVLPMQALSAAPSSWAYVLQLGAGAVAVLGSYHTVSAATTFLPPSGTTFNLRVGQTTNLTIAYSGSHTPQSWSASPNPVCPGMTLTSRVSYATIGGTPTTSGSYTSVVTAWANANNTGDHGNATYYFNVASTGPVITRAPTNQTVMLGADVTFSCMATGAAPLSFQWKFNNTNITGATSSNLVLNNVQFTNAGLYTIRVTNSTGAVSNNATLTVNGTPQITVAPVSQTVAPGANATLSVTALGFPPPLYRWQFNGASILGATNATLPLTSLQSSNGGTYTIVVFNQYGATNASATLTVNGPPAITRQPQDQYVAPGGTANFSVSAGGAATLTYQWRKNGTNILGQTDSTLSLSGVQSPNVAGYSVVVSNPQGSVTSSVAYLRLTSDVVTNTTLLLGLADNWAYNTNALDLGLPWREFDYNDMAWPDGPGLLGKLSTNNPVYPLILTTLPTSAGLTFITNFYFRAHFTVTNRAALTGLIVSNTINDGAVFYLNGTEIFRYNMPTGLITANTFASANLPAGVFTVSNVPPTLVVDGDNVLAVEVHQVNRLSSDILMGTAVLGTFLTPNSSAPAPRLDATLGAPGQFSLSFPTSAGFNYRIEYRDTLGAGNWQTLTNIAGSGGMISVPQNTAGTPQRFYRVTVSAN